MGLDLEKSLNKIESNRNWFLVNSNFRLFSNNCQCFSLNQIYQREVSNDSQTN